MGDAPNAVMSWADKGSGVLCRKPRMFGACSDCALSCGAVDPEGVKGCSHGWRVPAQRDAEPVGRGLFCCARPGGAMDCSCSTRTHDSLLRTHDVDSEARYAFDLLASGLGTLLRPAGAAGSRRYCSTGSVRLGRTPPVATAVGPVGAEDRRFSTEHS